MAMARFVLVAAWLCSGSISPPEIDISLFGALNTAVSGLSSQSAAFGNISDNVANSQTVGFKGTDTSFIDYLTTSTSQENEPGSVATRPDYTNEVQGAITQSTDPLALAINGQGFFAVAEPDGTVTGTNAPIFNPETFYTRAGDFSLDQNGYLVNSAGEYLEGWSANSGTGAVNQSQVAPIQVPETQIPPVATSQVTIAANLPTTQPAGTPATSQVQVYDALGNTHAVTMNWAQSATNPSDWTLTVSDGTDSTQADVQFAASGPTAGTMSSVSYGTPPTVITSGAANIPVTTSFGTFTLNLGTIGQGNGVTQLAASQYTLTNLTQNGLPPGTYTGVSITQSGNVVANYSNGQSQTVAQVPLITFANADALQRQNGQAFTATQDSGTPVSQSAGSQAAGDLVTGSVEGSNVDIATEFSKLIVAQEAYSANAKVVTTANNLLQTTINMQT